MAQEATQPTKHTPGPWVAHSNGVHKGTSCVAITHGDNTHANARLIAAAPSLLAALEECERELSKAVALMPRRYCNQEDNRRCENLLAKVRAAIAKAKAE